MKKNKQKQIIINENEILQKTKEFLKNCVGISSRGIILELENKERAIAYERENFVIVLPNGESESARLYGNWDEALVFAKRLLTKNLKPQGKNHIIVAEYTAA